MDSTVNKHVVYVLHNKDHNNVKNRTAEVKESHLTSTLKVVNEMGLQVRPTNYFQFGLAMLAGEVH